MVGIFYLIFAPDKTIGSSTIHNSKRQALRTARRSGSSGSERAKGFLPSWKVRVLEKRGSKLVGREFRISNTAHRHQKQESKGNAESAESEFLLPGSCRPRTKSKSMLEWNGWVKISMHSSTLPRSEGGYRTMWLLLSKSVSRTR
jgi:hypothetical protein